MQAQQRRTQKRCVPSWKQTLWLMVLVQAMMSLAFSSSAPFLPLFVIQLGVHPIVPLFVHAPAGNVSWIAIAAGVAFAVTGLAGC